MQLKRLISVFPCENIEDLNLERREADAEQLLSAWSVLWHPALLAGQDDIPCWLPPSTPPADPSDCLIVVPDCCESLLRADWLAEAEAAGACLLREMKTRDEMLEAALRRLGPDAPTVDPGLAADFLALGFCHLQVELLNRKSRYMSNLDESALRVAALDAARAAVEGKETEAREQLQASFDRLHEAREYFHPLDIRLLDLTLLAPTTLGNELNAALGWQLNCRSNRERNEASLPPQNFLVSAAVIEQLAIEGAEKLEALKNALQDGAVELIGGEYSESPLPLLGPEEINLNVSRGLEVYEKRLAQRPKVYGRRRFGLTPALPQVLRRLGFSAALHCTLDDGRFPVGSQARIRWEGFGATGIDSLRCVPLDASRSSSFLQLSEKLGDAMNLDQTPTVVFAHWPGRASHWYDDLRRIAAYGSVLGSFSTVSAYFDETNFAGHGERRKADDYRSPYLAQDAAAGRRDPISRWVRYFDRRAKLDTHRALLAMWSFAAGGRKNVERGEKKVLDATADLSGSGAHYCSEIDPIAVEIEDARDGEADEAALDAKLADMLDRSLAGFADALGGQTESGERGPLAVNPRGFRQRLRNVEVPAMGFAWLGGEPPVARKRRRLLPRRKEPPMAEPHLLRNEFFEVRFDPATGAIRSIWDYRSRGPRLSQQLALRLPRGGRADDEANYSTMAAERIEVTSAGPLLAEIVCQGRLIDRDGRRLAGFKQTARARRGSRILELLIELDVDRLPDCDPWQSYYAARFAWKDETLNVYRSANVANVPTELTRLESPLFIDLRRGGQRTTLLCGGLPYHRRLGLRKLDALLIVHGETARRFRLGVGIDAPHPMSAALGFISPPLELPDRPPPPSPTGWLFHLDCRNVQATRWEPIIGGFRVRLLETDGRGVRLGLRCFRAVASARIVPVGDAAAEELSISGDRVEVPVGPHQWIEVEIRWA
ncbi:MAG: hypothetical protein JW959_04770 [Pirellulales bacterium]|nr:hypothetical protein [Pirellulales bacterium]